MKNCSDIIGDRTFDLLARNAVRQSTAPPRAPIIIIIIIIITIIIGATGIVTRSLRKNLETVPGKHLIDSVQKTWNITHNTESTAV